ncbi:MAG: TetR family transcriptional regulator [Thermoanaerobaculaceae bacterium]|nr:TetR family transcriptional regulator [Thermoanaerobaculaceae bacterium]
MRGALGQRSRERKRGAILRAAVEVFSERGYFGARMREVAKRAGVADGTLYLYFEGKEHLLVSLLEEHARAFLKRARQDAAECDDPREKLRRVVERHLASLENDRALARVFQIELRHSRRFLRQVARGQVAAYLQLLQEIIEQGAAGGCFRADVPAEVAARAVFGAVDELITAWVLASRPKPLAEQSGPLLRLLLEGLEAHERRKR